MFGNLLLAVDGSEHALNAARVAGNLANSMKATTLRIVVAYDPIPPYLGEPNLQAAINARLTESQNILQKAAGAVGKSSAEIYSELIEGNPAEAIIKVADAQKSDLIIMGSRGLGRLTGLMLGSTSQKVVSHAPCPVLIVR
jgi:nucleotide-binding universal stress UspA family protein